MLWVDTASSVVRVLNDPVTNCAWYCDPNTGIIQPADKGIYNAPEIITNMGLVGYTLGGANAANLKTTNINSKFV